MAGWRAVCSVRCAVCVEEGNMAGKECLEWAQGGDGTALLKLCRSKSPSARLNHCQRSIG